MEKYLSPTSFRLKNLFVSLHDQAQSVVCTPAHVPELQFTYIETEIVVYTDSSSAVHEGLKTRDATRNTLPQGIAGRHNCRGIFLSSTNLTSFEQIL